MALRPLVLSLFVLNADRALGWSPANLAATSARGSMPPHDAVCAATNAAAQLKQPASQPQPQQQRRRAAGVRMMGRGRGRGNQAPPKKDTTPINGAIPFETMRITLDVGGGNDEVLGVMSKDEALEAARERELDLVLIAGNADPPVAKIVSYDKYRFAQEKKRKEQQKAAARGKSELKELKMSYKIGDHDYQVRKKSAVKFLSSGDKVKFSMLFRGREVSHSDVGREIMLRMAGELEDIGVLDAPPKVMGRQMIMMISPRPKVKGAAPPKKEE